MPHQTKDLAKWLINVFRELNCCLTVEEAKHVLIDATKNLMPYQTIAIMIINEDTEDLTIKTSRNLSYSFVKAFNRRATGQVLPRVILRHDKVVWNLLDPASEEYDEIKLEQDFSSVCLVPIVQEHRAIGYLHCDRAEGGEFSDDDAATLQIIAGIISLIIEKYQWMLLSRHLSRVDEVSNALKYNAFVDEFKRELPRSQSENTPLSLLMLDIDGYTGFIEKNGISSGHKLLAEIHRLIRSCLREHDLVGRFAADEFIVCMSGAERSECEAALESIRRTIEERAGEEWDCTVTISGVGTTLSGPMECEAIFEKILTTLGGGMINLRVQGPNHVGYAPFCAD